MGIICSSLINAVDIDEPIKVGNGNNARAVKKGTLQIMLVQANGDTMDIALHDYKYSTELGVCLFSIMKAIKKGRKLTKEGTMIKLTKGNIEIRFDRKTKTKDGVLCGVDLLPKTPEQANASAEQTQEDPKTKKGTSHKPIAHWDINKFHKMMGHASEQFMRATAETYGWKLTGHLDM